MKLIAWIFFAGINLLVLFARRPWPAVAGAASTMLLTHGFMFELGPARFLPERVTALSASIRALIGNARRTIFAHPASRLVGVWAVWTMTASYFHRDPSAAVIFRGGLVIDCVGSYLLGAISIGTAKDVLSFSRKASLILLLMSLEMLAELVTLQNFFAIWSGYGSVAVTVREGVARARGAFAHPILAGTVGGCLVPLWWLLWRKKQRNFALLGASASAVCVIGSGSSGPILSVAAAVCAIWFWRCRRYTPWIVPCAILLYIMLELVMQDPAYYIIAKLNVVGGSTGWHRARLIRGALEHFSEWWLTGTDVTRHWMPTGVSWSEEHADITNYYIKMGVWGGLPQLLLFLLVLRKVFRAAGEVVKDKVDHESAFVVWILSSIVFAFAISGLGVSFFDQSGAVFWCFMGMVIGLCRSRAKTVGKETGA